MLIQKVKKFLLFLSIALLLFLAFSLQEGVVVENGGSDIDYGYLPHKDQEEDEDPGEGEERQTRIAIIIDDLGNSFERDKAISNIDSTITLAVLPSRQDTILTADYFQDFERFQLILHLPLEPLAPEDAEPNMIMTDMNEEQIGSILGEYLNQLGDYVVGVNNHKGSKYTSNEEKMTVLLEELKNQGLFFVDSFTYGKSVAYEAAKEVGVKTAKRDIFLDNIDDKTEIRKQLWEAFELADKQGSAIAIGHSKQNTISVLEEEMPKLQEEGVEFVKVSELLE
ncbi:MAG: hypothetical protein GF370_05025 [Candidatus Nealsonbacteria bacterium]|nr:hypothetical protein [Candidatus Nealsonbacteria bacterium]